MNVLQSGTDRQMHSDTSQHTMYVIDCLQMKQYKTKEKRGKFSDMTLLVTRNYSTKTDVSCIVHKERYAISQKGMGNYTTQR